MRKIPLKLLYNPRDNFRIFWKSVLSGFLILVCSGSILTLVGALILIKRIDLDTMGFYRSKTGDSPIFNLPVILIGNLTGLLCNPFLTLPPISQEDWWWVSLVKGLGFGVLVGVARYSKESIIYWILLTIALYYELVLFNMTAIIGGFVPWVVTLIGNIVGITWVKNYYYEGEK